MLDRDDHRQLGQQLDLFHFQEEAPGMVFWHPRGYLLYRSIEDSVRRFMQRDGFQEVRAPQLLRQEVWEASGHWQHFRDNMMLSGEREALKPVGCPGHLEIFRRASASHRDLPLRLGEFGLVHRNEPSGSLHGLFRLRQFCQDDGHIFCAPEPARIVDEVARFVISLRQFYSAFGFHDLAVGFSSRPALRAGSDDVWDLAEKLLRDAAREVGLEFVEQAGEGAFYGPKLEFALKDRVGRSWQCGTIQLDFVLPERFGVHYVGASGSRERPAMLHRAMLGSLERFLGIVLEQHRGRVPAWLAPEQVVVLPVRRDFADYGSRVVAELRDAGLRARVDAREESLARRIAEAHEACIPFVIVAGERERSASSVSLRAGREGDSRSFPLGSALVYLKDACRLPELAAARPS